MAQILFVAFYADLLLYDYRRGLGCIQILESCYKAASGTLGILKKLAPTESSHLPKRTASFALLRRPRATNWPVPWHNLIAGIELALAALYCRIAHPVHQRSTTEERTILGPQRWIRWQAAHSVKMHPSQFRRGCAMHLQKLL